MHLTVLSQAVQLYMVQNEHRTSRNLRDKLMANNVSQVISKMRKVAVWAQNEHVSCLKNYNREDRGHHLRASLGNRYYPLAFTFFKGVFRSNFKSRTQSSEYQGTFQLIIPPFV
jgi:erythromycin esterase-like protein